MTLQIITLTNMDQWEDPLEIQVKWVCGSLMN